MKTTRIITYLLAIVVCGLMIYSKWDKSEIIRTEIAVTGVVFFISACLLTLKRY